MGPLVETPEKSKFSQKVMYPGTPGRLDNDT